MKSKFNIEDFVEHPITKDKLIVKDLEMIDNQYIYYFDKLLCFPEKVLKHYRFSFWELIFGLSEEEKNNQVKKAFDGWEKDIENYFKEVC